MKIKLNYILALFFLIFTTHSYSNVINTINFIGLNNATENSLLDKIPLKIGDEYSGSSSDSIIKSLFKTGLFSDISIINNEDILDITLVFKINLIFLFIATPLFLYLYRLKK